MTDGLAPTREECKSIPIEEDVRDYPALLGFVEHEVPAKCRLLMEDQELLSEHARTKLVLANELIARC